MLAAAICVTVSVTVMVWMWWKFVHLPIERGIDNAFKDRWRL